MSTGLSTPHIHDSSRVLQAEAPSFAQQAYQHIEAMIVTLRLPPGSFVTESQLIQELELGRTPIREALQRLATDGLVEILPRRGMRIPEIDLREQMDRLQVRRALELVVARLAAQRATPAMRLQFRALVKAMRHAVRNGNETAFMALDAEFHQLALLAADNPILTQTLKQLHGHARRFWYAHRAQAPMRQSARLHCALMLAIAQGDAALAQEKAGRLMRFVEKFTRRALLRADRE